MPEPITEQWLSTVGFKWHQFDRQPNKHWLLWLGRAIDPGRMFADSEDLGIEVTISSFEQGKWNCWLRGDTAGRYHRFIHIRYLRTQDELTRLIEGMTGQQWNPENNLYGAMRRPEEAARIRREHARLDNQIREQVKWYEVEKDDTRGRALPEHMEAAESARKERP